MCLILNFYFLEIYKQMSAHMPMGSIYQQAAAWELVVVSIILFLMICYRVKNVGWGETSGRFYKNFMEEKSWVHTFLYFVIFVLVVSAMLSFFIN